MNKKKQQSLTSLIAVTLREADTSYFFEDYTKQANAVLQALKSQGIMFVPLEATEEMIQAGVSAIGSGKIRPEDHVRYVYTDMVKAGKKDAAVV